MNWNIFGILLFGPAVATHRFFRTLNSIEAELNCRLREMYASENFRKHNIYPTTDATYIYAVMAMCLEIRSFGYSGIEICIRS